MICPSPLPKWYPAWERWREHGGLPSERPKIVPRTVALTSPWVYSCYRARHPKPKPMVDPYASLGVYERVAFFVNPTAGSPVGGAREILDGAEEAGVTSPAFNVGDGPKYAWMDWYGHAHDLWEGEAGANWARCDSGPRCASLAEGDIANIESPEMNAGFCTPKHALELVGPHGAIITEGSAPHSQDWPAVGSMPVFLEIDPTVAKIRADLQRVGVKGLVDYARSLGIRVPVPCFFIVPSDYWDGSEASFHTYWEQMREMWPAPLPFGIYNAELVPRWNVIR